MAADYSTYTVADAETSNAAKFTNLVNAIQASVNAIGDTTKMAFTSGTWLDLDDIKQGGATTGDMLAWGATAWGPTSAPGTEVDFVALTGNVNLAGTSEGGATSIVTATALPFNGQNIYYLEVYLPFIAVPGTAALFLYDAIGTAAATSVGYLTQPTNATGAGTLKVPVFTKTWLQPTSATHTFSIRGASLGGGATSAVNAGAGGAGNLLGGFIRIVKK